MTPPVQPTLAHLGRLLGALILMRLAFRLILLAAVLDTSISGVDVQISSRYPEKKVTPAH